MALKTKDYFKINGVSSDTFPNLLVNLPPVPPLAERKYTTYDVGGDEDYTIADDAFKDIKYTIDFITVDVPEYDNSALYKLVADAKTLEISRLPGYYYKVRKATIQAPTSVYDGEKVKYKVNFVLSPFKYHTDNSPVEIAAEGVVTNVGTVYSKPIIEFIQTETTTINVNGAVFEIMTTAERPIVIDSERKVTYNKNTGELIYNATKGEYPMLAVGNNIIKTNASSLLITKNERSY